MEGPQGPVRTSCFCPGTPHEEDEFHLVDAEHLPISAGVAAAGALSTVGDGNVGAVLIEAFLRHGAIQRWNLVDEDGSAVPINPSTVGDRLTWVKGGVELANAALERYVNPTALAPFGLGTSTKKNGRSSSGGRTAPSTSAKTRSSGSPRGRSGSSSPVSSDGELSVVPTP
jgi:hypothetical protein